LGYKTIIVDTLEYRKLDETDNTEPICICEAYPKRVITVYGYSKNFLMTALRLGYIIADKAIIEVANRICGSLTFTINSLAQRLGIYALRRRKEIQEELKQEY